VVPASTAAAPAAAAPTAEAAARGRFTDFVHVHDEPCPIVGLFDKKHNPEVSIEAAVAATGIDLSKQLFSGRRWIEKGGKAAVASVPEMTADMGLAIWLYTAESPLYPRLNGLLRGKDRATLKVHFFPYLRLLLSGLGKLRAMQGAEKRMVNRGVKLDLAGAHPSEYAHSKTLVWWPFSSTTSNLSVLSNPMFLGKSGSRTIFQIHTSKAVDISAFSAIKSEAELLLPPGLGLCITGVLPRGG